MCGICAIITPYSSYPVSLPAPLRGPRSSFSRSPPPAPRNPITQFKYEDKRPQRTADRILEPPYTEIQRSTSASRSRTRVPELTRERGFLVDTKEAEKEVRVGRDPIKQLPVTQINGNGNGDGDGEAVEPESTGYRKRLEEELLVSLENLAHRGPDGKGIWVSEDCRVALGHVRLSIRDLSIAGRQPMHSENDDVHIVVNGEIYDYEEIKSSLTSLGYHFQGSSDSELVLYLYLEYGEDFLTHLRGEFSLIVYDSVKKIVIAARDRYGIKPLFWTTTKEGRILIGAEMKAFLGLGLEMEWNVKCLRDCGWMYDTRTILKGVNRLRPGHMLVIGFDGRLDSKCYWKPAYPDKSIPDPRPFSEMVTEVRRLLVDSIACRLRADVPVGVYLSGGIDSSVVAGIVNHLLSSGKFTAGSETNRKLKCFTIEFDSGAHNEVEIAKRTADFLGVDFRAMHASEKMLCENFEKAVWAIEQPANDLNFVGKYMLSEFVSGQGYPVVLTGEGADENFGGYSLFLADYLAEQDKTSPSTAIDESIRERHLARVREMGKDAPGTNAFVPNPIQFDGKDKTLRAVDNLMYPQLQSNGVWDQSVYAPWTETYGAGNPLLTIVGELDGPTRQNIRNKWHPLHSALYLSHRPMDGIILSSLGDRSEMGHSLEARPPFLDHRFTEYVNQLPPSAKITIDEKGQVKEKYVLREASKPFITDELYNRTKHPYSAPATYPVGGLTHQLIHKYITKENMAMLGFVDVEYCLRLANEAFEENGMRAFRQCLMLAEFVILHKAFGMKTAREPSVL